MHDEVVLPPYVFEYYDRIDPDTSSKNVDHEANINGLLISLRSTVSMCKAKHRKNSVLLGCLSGCADKLTTIENAVTTGILSILPPKEGKSMKMLSASDFAGGMSPHDFANEAIAELIEVRPGDEKISGDAIRCVVISQHKAVLALTSKLKAKIGHTITRCLAKNADLKRTIEKYIIDWEPEKDMDQFSDSDDEDGKDKAEADEDALLTRSYGQKPNRFEHFWNPDRFFCKTTIFMETLEAENRQLESLYTEIGDMLRNQTSFLDQVLPQPSSQALQGLMNSMLATPWENGVSYVPTMFVSAEDWKVHAKRYVHTKLHLAFQPIQASVEEIKSLGDDLMKLMADEQEQRMAERTSNASSGSSTPDQQQFGNKLPGGHRGSPSTSKRSSSSDEDDDGPPSRSQSKGHSDSEVDSSDDEFGDMGRSSGQKYAGRGSKLLRESEGRMIGGESRIRRASTQSKSRPFTLEPLWTNEPDANDGPDQRESNSLFKNAQRKQSRRRSTARRAMDPAPPEEVVEGLVGEIQKDRKNTRAILAHFTGMNHGFGSSEDDTSMDEGLVRRVHGKGEGDDEI